MFFGCAWLLSAGFSYQNIWKANNLTQDDFVGKTITIKGFVTNIPTTLSRHVKDGSVERKVSRFNFTVDEVNQRKLTEKINIRLRWDDKPLSDEIISHIGIIEQGQRWQLKVRIKPAHGFANIGGFSYQTWLRQKKLHATGYVKHSIENKVIEAQSSYRQSLYLQLNEVVNSIALKSQRYHFIFALTFGERGKITAEQWQVLQATGTQHLMAISGLHLGLIASGAFGLMVMFFRFIPIHLLLSLIHI